MRRANSGSRAAAARNAWSVRPIADDCHRRTVAQHGVGSGLLDAKEGADCLQQHAAREAGMVRGGAEIEVEHLQRRWDLCCDCGDGRGAGIEAGGCLGFGSFGQPIHHAVDLAPTEKADKLGTAA